MLGFRFRVQISGLRVQGRLRISPFVTKPSLDHVFINTGSKMGNRRLASWCEGPERGLKDLWI